MSVDDGPFSLGDVGGSGPAVLCLHGLTGTPYEIRPVAEALAAAGFGCLGPLLPGHGSEPHLLARTRADEWIGCALDAFDRLARSHARVYVAGLSLGGLLALRVAASREVDGCAALAAPLGLRTVVRIGVRLLAPLGVSLPKVPGIRDPEARARHPGYDRMPLRAVRELLGLQRRLAGDLARVTAPLQLIYSHGDGTVQAADAERIAAAVGSQHVGVAYLEESDHVLPVDLESAKVTALTLDFFAELEAKARAGS